MASFHRIQERISQNIQRLKDPKKRKQADKEIAWALAQQAAFNIFSVWCDTPPEVAAINPAIEAAGKSAYDSIARLDDQQIKDGALFQALSLAIQSDNEPVMAYLALRSGADLAGPMALAGSALDRSEAPNARLWRSAGRFAPRLDTWLSRSLKSSKLSCAASLIAQGAAKVDCDFYFSACKRPESAPESDLMDLAEELLNADLHPLLQLLSSPSKNAKKTLALLEANAGPSLCFPALDLAVCIMAADGHPLAAAWAKSKSLFKSAGPAFAAWAGEQCAGACLPDRYGDGKRNPSWCTKAEKIAHCALQSSHPDSAQAFADAFFAHIALRCSEYAGKRDSDSSELARLSRLREFLAQAASGLLPPVAAPSPGALAQAATAIQGELVGADPRCSKARQELGAAIEICSPAPKPKIRKA